MKNIISKKNKTNYIFCLNKFLIAKIYLFESLIKKKIIYLEKLNLSRIILNEQLNSLFEELSFLQKEGSFIAEIIQIINKNKVLIKTNQDGKYIVHCSKKIDQTLFFPGTRVAIKNNGYYIHKILPSKIDPLISLMRIENVPLSTYEMIGGLDFQITQIKEVIELPIKFPEIFEILGVTQPKGVLLYGPPGTGKTLLARAVAHHSDCTFIRMSGSELVQKYIGEGSRMVREIFLMAKAHSPSIIFMDEVDSVGSTRGNNENQHGDSEVQRTMLELLNQLDGFEAQENIKIMMATNRIDVLDMALIRPGRIDRKIRIPNPNVEGRLAILKIHLKNIKKEPGIDLWNTAKMLNGASGADIKSICTEAGMFAIRDSRSKISIHDINRAIVKVTKKNLNFFPPIQILFS